MAMDIETTMGALLHQLGDMYDAEHRFLKGQHEMLQKASDAHLQDMIQQHIAQSEGQVSKLDQVYSILGHKPKGNTCDAAKGLVTEAQKTLKETKVDSVRDVLIAAAADRVEHYEIAGYRSLIAGVELLGKPEAVALLRENLRQEEQTAHLIEQSTPQLLQRAVQEEGLQGPAAFDVAQTRVDVGTATAGKANTPAKGMDTTPAKGERVTGDEYVTVKTTPGSDILVDESTTSGTSGRPGSQ